MHKGLVTPSMITVYNVIILITILMRIMSTLQRMLLLELLSERFFQPINDNIDSQSDSICFKKVEHLKQQRLLICSSRFNKQSVRARSHRTKTRDAGCQNHGKEAHWNGKTRFIVHVWMLIQLSFLVWTGLNSGLHEPVDCQKDACVPAILKMSVI